MRSLKQFRYVWLVCLLSLVPGPAAAGGVALIEMVKRGDSTALRGLLDQRVDVNAADVDGTTALHWAAHLNDGQAVTLLIQAGADVNARNRYGVTPLSLACTNGNGVVVDVLLKAGANPNEPLPEGETPLMTASRTGNLVSVRALLARGANANAKENWRGQSALMWAAAENNAAAAQALIEGGADLGARSNAGFTPLLYAARAGHIDAARVLLAAGADVNDTLPTGVAPLTLAIINAKYELAAFLLAKGANPNADGPGWTPLHQIAWTRRPNVGHNNPEPVHADNVDSLDVVKDLVARGADPNARVKKQPRTGLNSFNRIGATPFLLASKSVDLPMMRLLLEHGADPWLTNVDGTTALMVAAGVGMYAAGEDAGTVEESLEAVKLTFDMGFDITAVDKNGDTALHGAAFRGANDVVRFLVENGADLQATNRKGWTPLRVAEGVFINATLKSQPKTAALLRELSAGQVSAR